MQTPSLLLLALTAAAPPAAPTVGTPRLARGDELVYRGEVTEGSDRVTNRFRKASDLEVRVFVLETGTGYADCAVMTLVKPRRDAAIAGAASAITGREARTDLPPSVRVDLVRVDARGRTTVLDPPPGPPPIPLGPATPTAAVPPNPLDGPPVLELGMFVPLPPRAVGVGDRWDSSFTGGPAVGWAVDREAVWNGGRVMCLTATQQTEGWDRPAAAPTGWKRTDTVYAAPADGYAAVVSRRIERREGRDVVGWIEVRFDLEPPVRHVGARFADARREVEAAYTFGAEVAPLLPKAAATDPREFRARLLRIDRFLADSPAPTGFRPAIDSARRRCEAGARGDAPAAGIVQSSHATSAEVPDVGGVAPDFVAPFVGKFGSLRLAGLRGKPAIVVFFKPGSSTARPTLIVTDALHAHFGDRAAVVAVAIGADPIAAEKDRTDLRLSMPVVDGAGVREKYGIDTYPRFFAVDPAGGIAWRFDGFGLETGFLARSEVEKLLRPTGVPTAKPAP